MGHIAICCCRCCFLLHSYHLTLNSETRIIIIIKIINNWEKKAIELFEIWNANAESNSCILKWKCISCINKIPVWQMHAKFQNNNWLRCINSSATKMRIISFIWNCSDFYQYLARILSLTLSLFLDFYPMQQLMSEYHIIERYVIYAVHAPDFRNAWSNGTLIKHNK